MPLWQADVYFKNVLYVKNLFGKMNLTHVHIHMRQEYSSIQNV